ncbi:MAG: DNA-binding protein [Sulfuritalea sp.]|nr:DNA-binding protein [Sulfuritalea sp.]
MISTEELAPRIKVKPQTIRAAVCRTGAYYTLRPVKMPNRFLLWPDDAAEILTQQAKPNQVTA